MKKIGFSPQDESGELGEGESKRHVSDCMFAYVFNADFHDPSPVGLIHVLTGLRAYVS